MPDQVIKSYRTEVYLLFPECTDVGRAMSSPYIKGYTFDFEECSPVGLKEIMDVVDFFDYERIDYYYDSKNLQGLYYPNDVLDEYPFVDTMVRSSITQMGMENWREAFGEKNLRANWNGNDLNNDTCIFAHSRSCINNEREEVHATILSSGDAMVLVDSSISITNAIGDIIAMDVQTSVPDMYKWLCVNRIPQRRFDVNDKHGENGVGARSIPHKGLAGLLLCYRTEAQELLEKAIGKGKESDLWYYDTRKNEFIYFENQYESPQPAFHGYHVRPGEDGYDNIDMDRIKLLQQDAPTTI